MQKQKQQQSPKKPQRAPQSEPQKHSPNLLTYKEKYEYDRIVKIFSFLIVLMHILYLVIVFLNSTVNTNLDEMTREISTIESTLLDKSEILGEIHILNEKAVTYQEAASSKPEISKMLNSVFISQTPGILYRSVNLSNIEGSAIDSDSANADLVLEAEQALRIALLISKLLENENVDAVVINSATLKPSDNTFEVKLSVNFR